MIAVFKNGKRIFILFENTSERGGGSTRFQTLCSAIFSNAKKLLKISCASCNSEMDVIQGKFFLVRKRKMEAEIMKRQRRVEEKRIGIKQD